MNEVDEQFVVDLADNVATHEDWLGIVRFGFATLLERQELLIELIFREASRLNEESKIEARVVSDDARVIFDELGLRLVPRNT